MRRAVRVPPLLLTLVLTGIFGWGGPASAQEEGFVPWQGESATEEAPSGSEPPPPAPPPPPPPATPAPQKKRPLPPPTGPGRTAELERRAAPAQAPPAPSDFNQVSLWGAQTLGPLKRAVGLYVGFPLVGARAAMGLHERLDVGLGFDTYYGVMNELRALARVRLVGDLHWGLAFQVEGGHAFFTQRPEVEDKGPRWLTGRRNWNVEPGLLLSWRGRTVQSARFFLDVRYHLSLDTQPFSEDPLGGVPPSVLPGHNVPVRLGAEMPFSRSTSFLFMCGFNLHGRAKDARLMPTVSVGVVAGF